MQKKEQQKNLLKYCSALIITGLHMALWACFWLEYYANIMPRTFGWKGHLLVVAVYGVLMCLFTSLYGGYRVGYYRREDVALSGVLGAIFANFITYLQTCLIGAKIVSPGPFLVMTLIQAVLIFTWAVVATSLYTRIFPPHKMLMVYGGSDLAQRLIIKMITRSEKYQIRETISVDEDYERVCAKILEYRVIILCDVPAGLRNRLLKFCYMHSVRTYTTPKISDIFIRGAINISLFDTPLLLNRNCGLALEQRVFKRALDLFLALFGLVVFSPFFLLIPIVIKLYDGGPVVYSQDRLTLNGKVFKVYKFRSMCVDAEKDGAQLSTQEDERVTPVGRLMRAIRFDELPQLLNILRGDMSVVGPRPERPEIAQEYLRTMPEFSYRLKVKAGLTGYAQVVGRYNTTPYDKLKLDLMYISNYSLAEDFKLIFMTLKILFIKDSTQGIANGAKHANAPMKPNDAEKPSE